jgi:adenylate cyclase
VKLSPMPDARDVFISYARPSEEEAHRIAELLRQDGFSVWRDDELPAHRAYSDVIEERLKSAKAVVVLWCAESAKSHWVRAEADTAREAGTLAQASLDGAVPPMPFNQIQCADLKGWKGDTSLPGWRKLEASVAALVRGTSDEAAPSTPAASRTQAVRASICVLPFVNMSGEAEQEYFSDGISEDITTDLSKISALEVVARNTAFSFKGQSPDVKDVAKQLSVSHVLEGSVRKAGSRVRINAQLIDGVTGKHLWADRFDRDLTDIFAIQDEISKAIVDALKVKLLPKEKSAIEARGTESAEAYNLYLMARQQWTWGSYGNSRRDEAIVRFCTQAVKIDPNYADAWGLMALAQAELRWWHGKDDDPMPAAERALEINPRLAEPHCVKVRYFEQLGRHEEAYEELEEALRLSPESWEVNREAARLMFRRNRMADAIRYWEKASRLMESDFHSPLMLQTCYLDVEDEPGAMDAARRTLERAENTLLKDPTNGAALSAGSSSLIMLGEIDRGKDWLQRALLLDPDNIMVMYNSACSLTWKNADLQGALDLLEQYFERLESPGNILHAEIDPDMDPIRDDPRFVQMIAAAKKRLGMTESAAAAE